jgi:hypothetical protein
MERAFMVGGRKGICHVKNVEEQAGDSETNPLGGWLFRLFVPFGTRGERFGWTLRLSGSF